MAPKPGPIEAVSADWVGNGSESADRPTIRKAGWFEAVLGPEKGRFAHKNREKSTKNGEDLEVDLLIVKELDAKACLESAKITPNFNYPLCL
ncbi:MAG: hypothetical protein WDM87_17520 [Terracidiphilus sp.]